MDSMKENIDKAIHSAGFLRDELLAVGSEACKENPLLAILLHDVIADAANIENRLKEIQGVM
jgi:hypothetical protein